MSRLSKMHQRLRTPRNLRNGPPVSIDGEVLTEGRYGRWGWEGPNKADKGERLGSCNVTRCQREGAYWYNSAMRAWYCHSCARGINEYPLPNGTLLCTLDKEAEAEYVGSHE